jgi:hypothetical protein
MPDEESAVPSEFVPGAAALVPKAPPVTGDIECDAIPPRPKAAVMESPMLTATQRIESVFMIDASSRKSPVLLMALCRSCTELAAQDHRSNILARPLRRHLIFVKAMCVGIGHADAQMTRSGDSIDRTAFRGLAGRRPADADLSRQKRP